jgi:hypothetical protein
MYEPHHQPLATRRCFTRRVLLHSAAAVLLLAISLGIGMLGYEHSGNHQTPVAHTWATNVLVPQAY